MIAGPALATPPSPRSVVTKARAAQPAKGWATATFLQQARAGQAPSLALRVTLSPDGVIRQDVQRLRDGYAIETLVWADAAPDRAGVLPLGDAPGWLQVLSGRPLDAVLKAKSVDRRRTSYGHDAATILWVLGAGPQDPDLPQIQVERDSGRLRAFVERVAAAGGAATPVAVALSGQAGEGPARAAWPASVTISPSGGQPVTFALQTLVLGAPLADSELFPESTAPPAPADDPIDAPAPSTLPDPSNPTPR